MKDVIKEQAEILSKFSEMSLEQSESLIEELVVGFNLLTKEDLLETLNIVINIQNKKAISVEQLISSLVRIAPLSSAKQLDIEKISEYAACIGQITRESGTIIGNALKAILNRLAALKEARESLQEVGIEDFSNVEQVIDELAKKWNSLDREKRREIALKVAGRFQMSRFMILLDQLSEAE